VKGEGAIAFGGGAVMAGGSKKLLEESDPAQFAQPNSTSVGASV
jgi:hypothetical protein